MQTAKIKECIPKGKFFELSLIVGNRKPQRYLIEITLQDFELVKSSKECEFEANGQTLTKLFVGKKEILLNGNDQSEPPRTNNVNKQSSANKSGKQNLNKNRAENSTSRNEQSSSEKAKAPYNFVPIDAKVIEAKNKQILGPDIVKPYPEIPAFDRYHEGLSTGYIDLVIETLTPLYIRDANTQEEERRAIEAASACKECKDKKCSKCKYAKDRVNPNFFSPGETPKIPGSSLRGMVRNLVEIVSYSKMEYVDNTLFYHREDRQKVPYQKRVKDHIPSSNRNPEGTDFTAAIFGNADKFAGRVFFEDAKMDENAGQYPALSPRILSTPKPTAVRHYLVQIKTGLADWNGNTNIRGHKLYWHRRTSDDHTKKHYSWSETGQVIYDTQHTVIKPIKSGAKFHGRIRFENLSDVELGALLFALDLPPGCDHKIGMGKPLGLGSIRITPTVVISNRAGEQAGRYGKLFDDHKRWNLPEKEIDKDFKKEFSQYILAELSRVEKAGDNFVNDLWSIPRMEELWAMLRYDENSMGKRDWLERTRYMELPEFKKQLLLMSPRETLDQADIKLKP